MKYSLRSLMRFSIRDLLWLMVVVALSVGWWVDHWRQEHKEFEKVRYFTQEWADHNNELVRERDHRAAVESHVEWLKKRLDDSERQLLESVARGGPDNPLPASQAPAPNPPKD